MRTQNLTLAEEIKNIKEGKGSKAMKKQMLIKLGIRDFEANFILRDLQPSITRSSYTFGVEIECFAASSSIRQAASDNNVSYAYEGYNHRSNNHYYKFVSDASVTGMDNPIECVSPVLKGGKDGLKSLEQCCKALNEANAKVNKTCGLHVHIGAEKLSGEQYVNVFVNYQMLEQLIDSFMPQSRRGNNNGYCCSIVSHNFNECHNHADVRRELRSRYHKVNAESFERHKTIEFRQHSGTTDFQKISMWVKFCAKLVDYSKKHRLTERVNMIDEIPFINAEEKRFFNQRRESLA